MESDVNEMFSYAADAWWSGVMMDAE